MSVVAGLDIGTQSVKLLVYDTGYRRTLAIGERPRNVHRSGRHLLAVVA